MNFDQKLIDELNQNFEEHFGEIKRAQIYLSPAVLVFLGEHTHYNDGIILSAAINKFNAIKMSPRKDEEFHLVIKNQKYDISRPADEIEDRQIRIIFNSFKNVVAGLKEKRNFKGGVNCAITSDVPVSIGLGTSSAAHVGILKAINDVMKYNLTPQDLVNYSRSFESSLIGKISNKAHHYTAAKAFKNNLMLIDLRTDTHKYLPFENDNYKIVVCDTQIEIDEPQKICNERIEECEVGVKGLRLYIWGIKKLRDVKDNFLEKHINMIPRKVYNRCLYNVKELLRVEQASKALKKNLLSEFGQQVYDAHNSLFEDYEIGYEETNFLVDQTKEEENVLASKIICCSPNKATMNLVKNEYAEEFQKKAKKSYKQKYNQELNTFAVDFSVGLKRL